MSKYVVLEAGAEPGDGFFFISYHYLLFANSLEPPLSGSDSSNLCCRMLAHFVRKKSAIASALMSVIEIEFVTKNDSV